MGKNPGKRSAPAAAVADATEVEKPIVKVDRGLQSLMDHGDHIEEFVAIFAHLPDELTADLKMVASLNKNAHRLTAELSRDQAEILERAKAKLKQATAPEHVEGLVDQIELNKALSKRRRLTQELNRTVDITKRMYEKLDACINRVDDEISRLEEDVKENYGAVPDYASLAPPEIVPEAGLPSSGDAAAKNVSAAMASTGAGGKVAGSTAAGASAVEGAAEAVTQDLYNPNEPLYCICRQVGYGDMIGCDNDDCEHGEWFHYTCVGLEKREYEFWLCPGCSRDAEEKERRRQVEHMRIAAIMRSSAAANAVQMDAVKLPSDGEDDSDDDGDDDNDDEEADDMAEAVREEGASNAGNVSGRGGQTCGVRASPSANVALHTESEGPTPSDLNSAEYIGISKEGTEDVVPSPATLRRDMGCGAEQGNRDAFAGLMQHGRFIGDITSMQQMPPVSSGVLDNWVEGTPMRGEAGGREFLTGVRVGNDGAIAQLKPVDKSSGTSNCDAVAVVGVCSPSDLGSRSSPSDTVVGVGSGGEVVVHDQVEGLEALRIQKVSGQSAGTVAPTFGTALPCPGSSVGPAAMERESTKSVQTGVEKAMDVER